MQAPSVLVVDDDPAIRDACREVLLLEGFEVTTVDDGGAALEEATRRVHDVVLLDLRLPGCPGMEVLRGLKATDPAVVVVVITGVGTVEVAVEAMKLGAFDFMAKPFTPGDLREVARRGVASRRPAPLADDGERGLRADLLPVEAPFLEGSSQAIRHVRSLVRRVAPTDCTVLLLGETGTGKELVARLIHEQSSRRDAPLLTVDCGALVESLFESELFGHTKGSFTGAMATRHGRFELASGGTLFFDEIGNISLQAQSKLLRVLQEREVTRVGSARPIRVDVRIVAATNSDLVEAVRLGIFREDLFYRLSVVPIEIPPLRARLEDIPALAEHFVAKHGGRRQRRVCGIAPGAIEILGAHHWPGNVRELETVIERAIVMAEGDVVTAEDVAFFGERRPGRNGAGGDHEAWLSLEELEAEHVHRVLRANGGHIGRTAAVLGIDRKTLRMKMRRHGLTPRPDASPGGQPRTDDG